MINLKRELIKTCFEPYSGNFAAGDPANNKMNTDRLAERPELKEYCVRQMGSLAIVRRVDFVTAVPNGANWIAEEVASRYGLPYVRLAKWPDTEEIDFQTQEDYELACRFDRGLIFEDVARTWFSLRQCLVLKPLDQKLTDAASIFDRGDPGAREPLPVAYRALAREYIPLFLPDDSPYWRYADDRS